MRRAVVPVVVFALGLAACSPGGSSKSAANHARTPRRPVKPSADVVALAARFDCHGAQPRAGIAGTALVPVEIYQCALPKGLDASIVAYTPAQMRQLREPATLRPVCRHFKPAFAVSEIYAVYGKDYAASVGVGTPSGNPKTFKTRSEALARALGTSLTTVPCD